MNDKKNKKTSAVKACFRAIRPCHVAKNFLLFIPLLVGHHYFNLISLKNSLIGFLIFSLLASSAYLINDLIDLEKDKQHSEKQKRPFASGELPLSVGFLLAPCLLIIALGLSFYLPFTFLLGAVAYYALTLLYSFFIKQKKWLDIFLLTILYCLRVFSGMTLVENGYSLWLIIFVVFLFFSLALLKRYAELYHAKVENKTFILGRAYQLKDSAKLVFLGQASAYLSILTFIFYIHSKKVLLLYKSPLLLWLICPCLFIWLKRLWHFAQQGKIHDDPVVFTVMDSSSWVIVVIIAAIGLLAV
ncbi:MAG: UbiA family prenyltransferase [Pseudomonadota bacterium]